MLAGFWDEGRHPCDNVDSDPGVVPCCDAGDAICDCDSWPRKAAGTALGTRWPIRICSSLSAVVSGSSVVLLVSGV